MLIEAQGRQTGHRPNASDFIFLLDGKSYGKVSLKLGTMATKLSSLTRWLREYRVLSRYKTQWSLAALFLLLAAGATLAVPLAFRDLVDTGLTSDAINLKFINLLLLAIALALMTASRFYVMSWLGERVVADIRKRVFENVLRQSPAYFETLQTGEVLSRMTSDTTLVQTLVGSSISIALRSLVMLLGGMTMMLVTSAWLASVMIILLLMIVLPLWALGRRVRKMSRASQDKVADTSAMAGEVLNAITTVQAFVREPHEQKRFDATVEMAFSEAKKTHHYAIFTDCDSDHDGICWDCVCVVDGGATGHDRCDLAW
jgi:ATP-binding cassette subfamily B protein